MSFNFSNIKANLEGINKYLESNGIKLSTDETKQLESIFTQADKSVYKENEDGYNNGELDLIEQMSFKQQLSSALPKIKEKIKEFFNGVNKNTLNKTMTDKNIASADATRVDKQKVTPSNIKGEVKPKVIKTKITSQYNVLAKKDTVYDNKVMDEALNNLVKNNSKLKNKASAFIKSAQRDTLKNQLDPFVLIAISMHESANGVSKASLQKNNIGGIMGKGGLRRFDNVESCIDSIANTVNTRVSEGRKTISSIGYSGRYCAKSAAPNWVAQVTKTAENLRQEYNKLLEQKYRS